jgi:hypothetical protein
MFAGYPRDRWYRFFSGIVIVSYLTLALLYMLVIPAGESPDEPSHLQCIEQVSLRNRIPVIDPRPQGTVWWARERIISGLVCFHMPLYYLLAGYTQKLVHLISAMPIHYEFPANNPLWETGASVAMFAQTPKTHPLAVHEPVTLTMLRVENILLGLMSIFVAGHVARRLAPGSPDAALIAMTLVAGWPQFLFMSRAINNDGLAVALSVGVLAVLVDVGKPRRYVMASVLAALAILTKLTMIFAIAAIALALVLEIFMSRNESERRRLLWAGLVSAFILGLLGLLFWFQPTLHAHLRWSQDTMRSASPQAITFTYWLNVLKMTFQSGWGRFGWMNLATPDIQVTLWWAAMILTGIVGLASGLRHAANPTARLVTLIACVWVTCVLASYLRIQINRFQPQFRYALAAVPALAAFSGTGTVALLGDSQRLRRAAALIMLAILLAVNLWIVFGLVAPAYA